MQRLNTRFGRFLARLENWFVDHELLRKLYRNFHRLSPNAFRSNQPSAGFLKKLQRRHGLKTVISMRKANRSAPYRLEKQACDRLGLTLVNHAMSSRKLPEAQKILDAKRLLETVDYPILIHCKSGADRAGLMSVLYMHFIRQQPMEEAVKQLHIKYGHFRWADTGKLDFFFDAFFDFQKTHPEVSFEEWVSQHYDRAALDGQFHSAGWANIVVNKILRRE
jgi:protein tyrosine phosphatase (PTP) superfamily phosphohydrolase (DUF442 family)